MRAMQSGGGATAGGGGSKGSSSSAAGTTNRGLLFCRLFRAAADRSRAAFVALLKPNDCLDNMLALASSRLAQLSTTDIKASLIPKDADFLALQSSGGGGGGSKAVS